jgi:hypothetical protein
VDNDKAFAGYALILIAGLASLLTASVLGGIVHLPATSVFLEHVALGLAMRASYKSIGGWDWADWSVGSEPAGAARVARGLRSPSGAIAHAEA